MSPHRSGNRAGQVNGGQGGQGELRGEANERDVDLGVTTAHDDVVEVGTEAGVNRATPEQLRVINLAAGTAHHAGAK
jgi:hypothetical protein